MRAVMEVMLLASNGAASTCPSARTSPSMGCTMQAVPQPKISLRRPSAAACTQGTALSQKEIPLKEEYIDERAHAQHAKVIASHVLAVSRTLGQPQQTHTDC